MHVLFLMICTLAAGGAWAQREHHDGGTSTERASRTNATREWTPLPLLLPAGVQQRGQRAAASLRAVNLDAAELTVYAPGGAADRRERRYPLGAEGARIEAAAPGVGNYHWVTAQQVRDGEVRTASTAWYFSNPGPAPTALLREARHELEIIPDPLPREHSHYRESEKWRFVVRWQGAPLANHALTLETQYGSRSRLVTDANGIAVVLFPRDFERALGHEEGHGGPRRAGFVLATKMEDGGKQYLTAFNYTYSPDPDRERSLAWGAAFGLAGMIAALPLLRRRPREGAKDHA